MFGIRLEGWRRRGPQGPVYDAASCMGGRSISLELLSRRWLSMDPVFGKRDSEDTIARDCCFCLLNIVRYDLDSALMVSKCTRTESTTPSLTCTIRPVSSVHDFSSRMTNHLESIASRSAVMVWKTFAVSSIDMPRNDDL